MIAVFYPQNSVDITGWKERLDMAFLTLKPLEAGSSSVPRLTDGEKQAEGIASI
jgi:hypothetical protein